MIRLINDMNSSDARAILAQIPCDFNGGEICMSIRTLHHILCTSSASYVLKALFLPCRTIKMAM
jgi:hypothetical protein